MKNLLGLILFFFCLSHVSAQQLYNITGIVTDENDAPIPGATVFIADSRKATATDSEGKFALWQVQPGKYNLVVKMIGYTVITHEFLLQNGNARFRFKLAEDNVMLKTVEISAMSWAERKGHLATFIRCFLGNSKNAAQCKILNTDDISLKFNKKTGVLTASSNEFLIIENKALGYRMKYLLNSFLYDRSSFANSLISFDGTLFFEDMTGNPRQVKRWEAARADTYLGSIQNYFRSVYNNTQNEDGFITYVLPNPHALDSMVKNHSTKLVDYFQPVNALKSYINEVDSNFISFDLGKLQKDSTELYVLYTGKKEPQDFMERGPVIQRFFKMPTGQLSIMRPMYDSLLISQNGDISPVAGVLFAGFWAWGQVSSFLPSDYELPPGTKLPTQSKFNPPAGTISVRPGNR